MVRHCVYAALSDSLTQYSDWGCASVRLGPGSIPTEIGLLRSLENLTLDENRLSGACLDAMFFALSFLNNVNVVLCRRYPN